jgi:LAGLIDADG endonuclease
MRTNGMSLHKLPLFVWSIFVTAILLLLALPVLAGKFYNVNTLYIVPALNLAICWKHFFNFLLESQSAGNFIDLNLFMILREYMPEMICCNNLIFKLNLNLNLNLKRDYSDQSINSLGDDYKFITYLTGLFEGDGKIFIPTKEMEDSELLEPVIQIEFNTKDLPLAVLIQKKLGYGFIKAKNSYDYNAYVLHVNRCEDIFSLVELFNGNMKTPKIIYLYNLID